MTKAPYSALRPKFCSNISILLRNRTLGRDMDNISILFVLTIFISLIWNRTQSSSVAHWHSARWGWNGYQPGLGSIPRPGKI